jgi:type II secretory pathway pseudopilin PulG
MGEAPQEPRAPATSAPPPTPAATPCPHRPLAPEQAACASCGRSLCGDCLQRIDGRSLCADCRPTRPAPTARPGPAAPAVSLLALGIGALLGSFGLALLLAWHGTQRRARADRETLARLRFALEDFYLDLGRYPSASEGFAALVSSDPDLDGAPLPGWRGPYLDLGRLDLLWSTRRGGLSDRRGNAVLYYANPQGDWVYLASPGPDGLVQTAGLGGAGFGGVAQGDDVVVWVEGP